MTVIGNAKGGSLIDLASKNHTGSRDDSFSRVMDEIDRRERPQSTGNSAGNGNQRANNGHTENSNNTNSTTANRQSADVRRTGEGRPAGRREENVRVQETADSCAFGEAVLPLFSEEVKEELVCEIADTLEVTPAELVAAMVNIGINLEDLAEAKNVSLLISDISDVENPVQLLAMDGVKEMFLEIDEAVLSAYEKMADTAVKDEAVQTAVIQEGVFMPLENAEETFEQTFDLDEELSETVFRDTTIRAEVSDEQGAGQNQTFEDQDGGIFAEAGVNADDVSIAPGFVVENKVTATTVSGNSQTAATAANKEIANQILEKIKIDVRPGVSEIKMNLKPESLGEISLRIASENGIITAHFVAESQRVKEIIESNFNQLKDSLAEQGVNISELSVSVSTGGSQQHMSEFLKERSKSQARIANILASLESEEPEEVDEADIYDNTLNIKI
jgi:flagellar hook-length control protein FliK